MKQKKERGIAASSDGSALPPAGRALRRVSGLRKFAARISSSPLPPWPWPLTFYTKSVTFGHGKSNPTLRRLDARPEAGLPCGGDHGGECRRGDQSGRAVADSRLCAGAAGSGVCRCLGAGKRSGAPAPRPAAAAVRNGRAAAQCRRHAPAAPLQHRPRPHLPAPLTPLPPFPPAPRISGKTVNFVKSRIFVQIVNFAARLPLWRATIHHGAG